MYAPPSVDKPSIPPFGLQSKTNPVLDSAQYCPSSPAPPNRGVWMGGRATIGHEHLATGPATKEGCVHWGLARIARPPICGIRRDVRRAGLGRTSLLDEIKTGTVTIRSEIQLSSGTSHLDDCASLPIGLCGPGQSCDRRGWTARRLAQLIVARRHGKAFKSDRAG